MAERYHLDLSEPGLLEQRSWRWLRVRILGLLPVDSRLHMALGLPPVSVTCPLLGSGGGE